MKNSPQNSILILFCLLSSIGLSQRSSVTFSGTVTENGATVAGVHVFIIDAGARKSEMYTDSTGKYTVDSYYNKMIYIKLAKDGYVAQAVRANTRLRNMAQYNMTMKLDFELIKQPKDGRILTFKDPLGKIKYNYKVNKFRFDTAYQATIEPKYDQFLKTVSTMNTAEQYDSISSGNQ
jgi:hypothetical protein